jgi:hypothetical protein
MSAVRSLSGVKRTYPGTPGIDANDPERTSVPSPVNYADRLRRLRARTLSERKEYRRAREQDESSTEHVGRRK